MIEQLRKAVEQAAQRSEEEQRVMAELLFEAMDAEQRWEELFSDPRSEQLLARMVAEAIAEDEAGETEEITGERFL